MLNPENTEELAMRLQRLAFRMQCRVDAILESHAGNAEAAVTGPGVGISYSFARQIATAFSDASKMLYEALDAREYVEPVGESVGAEIPVPPCNMRIWPSDDDKELTVYKGDDRVGGIYVWCHEDTRDPAWWSAVFVKDGKDEEVMGFFETRKEAEAALMRQLGGSEETKVET